MMTTNRKDDDTKNDGMATITIGKGGEEEGIGNEVIVPNGQEDPIKHNTECESLKTIEDAVEDAAVKKKKKVEQEEKGQREENTAR